LYARDYGYFGYGCAPSTKTSRLGTEDLRYNADSYGCLVERLALEVVLPAGPPPLEP
jgi:hypothetical protein